jgi:hypothetical protein
VKRFYKTANLLILILGVLLILPIQASPYPDARVSIGSEVTSRDSNVAVPINFSEGAGNASTMQFDIELPDGVLFINATTGPAAASANKDVQTNDINLSSDGPTTIRFIIFGLNLDIVRNGTLSIATFYVNSSASSGQLQLSIAQLVISDNDANEIPSNGSDGSIYVPGLVQSPANGTLTNSTNVTFHCELAGYNVTNLTLDVRRSNNTLIFSNTTQSSGSFTSNNWSILLPSNGDYNWECFGFDNGTLVNGSTYILSLDATAPSIVLNSPQNSNTTSASINFNMTGIDNHDSSLNCSLFIDAVQHSNFNLVNNTPTTIAGTLAEGNHTWYASCSDNAGNTNFSQNRTIMVDLTNPMVTLISPPDASILNSSLVALNFTANDNCWQQMACRLYINNTLNRTLSAANNSNYSLNLSFSSGQYSWSINCTDGSGRVGQSTSRTLSTDLSPPNITISSPTNRAYSSNTTYNPNVYLNFSVSDATGVSCYYRINTSSFYNTSCSNYSQLYLGTGRYNITINANDSAGNAASSIVFFNISDTTAPIASGTLPSGTIAATTSTTISITTDENASCRYSSQDTVYDNMTSNFTDSISSHSASISVAYGTTYNFYVRCRDISGNKGNASATISFSVTAQSSGSSGGGGGGGGGIPGPPTYAISSSQLISGLTKIVVNGTVLKIPSNGKQLEATIISVTNSAIALRLGTDITNLATIYLDSGRDLDINRDGTIDLGIVLNGVSNNTANITISSRIPPSQASTANQSSRNESVTAQSSNQTINTSMRGTLEESKANQTGSDMNESSSNALQEVRRTSFAVILATICLIITILLVIRYYRRKRQSAP